METLPKYRNFHGVNANELPNKTDSTWDVYELRFYRNSSLQIE